MDKISRMIAPIARLLILAVVIAGLAIGPASVKGAEGLVGTPSFEVSLNVGWLNRNVLSALGGNTYGGQYTTNGLICKKIQFFPTLTTISLNSIGHYNIATGGHWIDFGVNAQLSVPNNCNGLVTGNCNVLSRLASASDVLTNGVGCDIDIFPFIVKGVAMQVRFKNPFAMPASFMISLKPTTDQPTKVQVESGSLVNDRWTSSKKAALDIPVMFGTFASGSHQPPSIHSGSPIVDLISPDVIGFGVTVDDETLHPVDDVSNVPSVTDRVFPFDNADVLQLSISPRLFGSVDPAGSVRDGILGNLLPLRIQTLLHFGPFRCTAEVFLTGASVVFGVSKTDNKKLMTISFETAKTKICGSEIIGRSLIRSVGASLVVYAPMFARDGQLTTPYKESSFYLKTVLGPVIAKANMTDAARAISRALPSLGSISKGLDITLPDCISVQDRNISASFPCNDPPGARDGYIKHLSGDAHRGVVLDFQSAKYLLGTDGTYYIRLPGKVTN